MLVTLIWFVASFVSSVTITSIIKRYDGRLRPDFYAMCNYKGYRWALEQCEYASDWQGCLDNAPQILI